MSKGIEKPLISRLADMFPAQYPVLRDDRNNRTKPADLNNFPELPDQLQTARDLHRRYIKSRLGMFGMTTSSSAFGFLFGTLNALMIDFSQRLAPPSFQGNLLSTVFHVVLLLLILNVALMFVRPILNKCMPRTIKRRAELMLSGNLCGCCAYPLDGLVADADGCIVCPECGAAWKSDKVNIARYVDGDFIADEEPPTITQKTKRWLVGDRHIKEAKYRTTDAIGLLVPFAYRGSAPTERTSVVKLHFSRLRPYRWHATRRFNTGLFTLIAFWIGLMIVAVAQSETIGIFFILGLLITSLWLLLLGIFAKGERRAARIRQLTVQRLREGQCPSCCSTREALIQDPDHSHKQGRVKCTVCCARWDTTPPELDGHTCYNCGYMLVGIKPDSNAVTVCPECGSPWRITAHDLTLDRHTPHA